nr:protein per1 like [Quercus suber]
MVFQFVSQFDTAPSRYTPFSSNSRINLALQRRLLLWTCPTECDYSCQHIITTRRLEREPAYLEPVVQFHGKWPFYRFGGMQEPASVLFSLGNFLAHSHGLSKLKEQIPARYSLRKYYILFGYFGLGSWTFSMIFHTRDFSLTEKLDYFGAGASVMYGLYYAPIRIFRLDKAEGTNSTTSTLLRLWTFVCVAFYTAHISYLTFVRFDYTYNMAANVVVGIISNILWTGFSIMRFRKIGRMWAAWPGLIVAWVILAMSLELFDFAPWWGMVDAHALWHLGTVGPTIWWYKCKRGHAEHTIEGVTIMKAALTFAKLLIRKIYETSSKSCGMLVLGSASDRKAITFGHKNLSSSRSSTALKLMCLLDLETRRDLKKLCCARECLRLQCANPRTADGNVTSAPLHSSTSLSTQERLKTIGSFAIDAVVRQWVTPPIT